MSECESNEQVLSRLRSCALTPPASEPAPSAHGRIRERDDEFQVHECLGWRPQGEGEHLYLYIERAGMSTPHVLQLLSRHMRVAVRDIGVAGLKDRHALTRQWFSVPAAGLSESPSLPDGMHLIEAIRHRRKLRRGAHRGNAFRIRVIGGGDDLLQRSATVSKRGVPNYFGRQRFGHGGKNIDRGFALLTHGVRKMPWQQRSLAVSALRSALFNAVLARRVANDSWATLLPGELAILDGTHSFFPIGEDPSQFAERLADFDIHPSGPLWGRGETALSAQAAQVEALALADASRVRGALESLGLRHERRALRLRPQGFSTTADGEGGHWFEFQLPAGAYATTVLSALFILDDVALGSDV